MRKLFPILCLLCYGCDNYKEIENFCGSYPIGAKNIHYEKIQLSQDYLRPYCVFIKFNIDSNSFSKFVQSLNLTSYRDDYKKMMCMEGLSPGFVSRFWDFETNMEFNTAKRDIDWWDPSPKKMLLYAGFYNDNEINRIVQCYNYKWNGRILIGYYPVDRISYVLIETLL